MKLTDWIDGDIKPVRVGVYERDYDGSIWFCKWDGEEWKVWFGNIDDADKETEVSYFQNLPWRGLAEEPK